MNYEIQSIRSNLRSSIHAPFGLRASTQVFLFVLSFSTEVKAQSSTEVDLTLQNLLNEIATKRDLAEKSLAQMPDQVSEEIAYIMADFNDSLADRVQQRFTLHYENVEESLDTVSLPTELGNLEVAWQQLKAGTYDSRDLDRLVEDFINQAHRTLEPHREELSAFMEAEIERFLNENLKRSQEKIWTLFAEVPGRYFPSLQVPILPPPSLPDLPNALPGSASSYRGVVGLAGAALLLRGVRAQIAKKIPDRIKRKIKKKMLGKVAAKGIPFIGLFLIGLEVWDASQAKVELERELREGFLNSYRTEFSSQTMLDGKFVDGEPSLREQVRAVVRDRLNGWTRHSRLEIERLVEAAEVVSLSPQVKTYIQNEVGKGRNSREIVEDLLTVQTAYPPKMIRDISLRKLLGIRRSADVLDNEEFRHLSSQLESRLLQEFERHRREVFLAADLLGVSVFLEFIRSAENLDWFQVRTIFERYPPDMSESARRGLLLAINEKAAQTDVPSTTLANIHRHSTLFRELVSVLPEDRTKLYQMFGDPSHLGIVNRAMHENPEAARSFVNHWKVQAWERYRNQKRLDALLEVVEHRLSKGRQLASELAQEMAGQDELTPIVLDVGICGLQIWDTYVGRSSGRLQRERATAAIQLYRNGYPCELVLTMEGLEDAKLYNALPFGIGVVAFRELGPVFKLIYLGVIAIVLVAIVVAIWRLIRMVRSRTGVVRLSRHTSGERPSKLMARFRSVLQTRRSEEE